MIIQTFSNKMLTKTDEKSFWKKVMLDLKLPKSKFLKALASTNGGAGGAAAGGAVSSFGEHASTGKGT